MKEMNETFNERYTDSVKRYKKQLLFDFFSLKFGYTKMELQLYIHNK